MKEKLKIFLNGLIYENPTFVIFLGMCPVLGTTNTIENAVYMSLCVFFVLILSNIIISLIRKIVPNEVRIPVYIIIIATLVTIVDMLFHAYLPFDIYKSLGSFISLIVVNCIILGRAESFASKNNVGNSIIDACGYALGFAWALIVVAFFRELIGTGCLSWAGHKIELFPDYAISIFASNAGAFIALGLVVAGFTAIMNAVKANQKKAEKVVKEFTPKIEKAEAELKAVEDKKSEEYQTKVNELKALKVEFKTQKHLAIHPAKVKVAAPEAAGKAK